MPGVLSFVGFQAFEAGVQSLFGRHVFQQFRHAQMRVRKVIATSGEHLCNMLQFSIFRHGALRHQAMELRHFTTVIFVDRRPCRLCIAMVQTPSHQQLAFMRRLVRLGFNPLHSLFR